MESEMDHIKAGLALICLGLMYPVAGLAVLWDNAWGIDRAWIFLAVTFLFSAFTLLMSSLGFSFRLSAPVPEPPSFRAPLPQGSTFMERHPADPHS